MLPNKRKPTLTHVHNNHVPNKESSPDPTSPYRHKSALPHVHDNHVSLLHLPCEDELIRISTLPMFPNKRDPTLTHVHDDHVPLLDLPCQNALRQAVLNEAHHGATQRAGAV